MPRGDRSRRSKENDHLRASGDSSPSGCPDETRPAPGQIVRPAGRHDVASRRNEGRARLACRLLWLVRVTPAYERPRERLFQHGGDPLTSEELIALVLGTGSAGKSAVEVARSLLQETGGLVDLSRANPRELARVRGIGTARAARLVAAFQLGKRALAFPSERPVLREPGDVYRLLQPRLQGMTQEVFVVLALDVRNGVVDEIEVARGTLTGVEVHPREVFRPLVRQAAAAAIVAHNHPSGDARPSPDDIALTRRLQLSGELLGIPILDHIVIGRDDFTSVAEMVGAACEGEDAS
jgi:DNA repair protein RadC